MTHIKTKPKKYDFKGLESSLMTKVGQVLSYLLPNGLIKGSEYVCGDIYGSKGKSFRFNLSTAKWADFAGSVSGVGIIALCAACKNIKQSEAYIELFEKFGNGFSPNQKTFKPVEKEFTAKVPPKGSYPPSLKTAHQTWVYKNKSSEPLMYVHRFDKVDGTKIIHPSIHDGQKWIKNWPTKNRIPYNLNLILSEPKKEILIVEGEKSAEAARKQVQDYFIVTTWAGGSNSWNKTDWQVLTNRSVLLWPDQDLKIDVKTNKLLSYSNQPGPKSMTDLARHLTKICKEVKLINVENSSPIDGFDAADAAFFGLESFLNWCSPRVETILGGDQ